MLPFQIPLCRVQGSPGRGTGAAAGENREAEVPCPWPPLTTGAAAFLSALSIELHVRLHLNKSILLLKKRLESIGFDHVFLCYHIRFSTPQNSASLEHGLSIYLFIF